MATGQFKRGRVSERLVAQLWKRQALRREDLVTSGGSTIRVLFPGRENEDNGPDFLGAILATEGGMLWRGDIEVHVRSGDWQSHGHHRDPNYNGVILHVVMWQNEKEVNCRQNGETIPVVSLDHYLKRPIEELLGEIQLPLRPTEPCSRAIEHLGAVTVAGLLDGAGEERFCSRAKHFATELADKERGQVLYEGIMEALGYARNKQPFRELAQRLPLSVIEGFSQSQTSSRCAHTLQALFLGTAGLLPRQRRQHSGRGEGWAKELERLWRSEDREQEMEETDWHFFRVRPENFPARRLAAASALFARYRVAGLLTSMLKLANQAVLSQGYQGLEQGLEVAASGYWAGHFDFGVAAKRRIPHLIGQSRAREIAVNILLPFFFAWAEIASEPGLREGVRKLYQIYPKLGENRLTRQMKRQIWEGKSPELVNSARRQQGLIHLYKTFCLEGRCAWCPLGYSVSE